MRAELSPPVISISMKPHHLFRYPSEWDPRQNGKTKGGYLEGKIQLPKTSRNLRVLLSTHPEVKHKFPDVELSEADREIHPTLLHVVRKGRGNRRYNEKEPVPNIQHWQQEFEVRDRRVYIKNKVSDMDFPRFTCDNERIQDKDEMFTIKEDMVLSIGKEAGELNMIILIPKTDKRANSNDVSLNKLLESRIQSNQVALKAITETYSGKNSVNLKKVCLRLEVFCLETGLPLGSSLSVPISDTASKTHGAMDLHDATPLRSCAEGRRKVVMIAEFGLAKDVEPKFLLYDSEGRRLVDKEESLLVQPADFSVMKESIIFITPAQPCAEAILVNNYKIKLVARRASDGYISRKKFDFDFVPHDFYSTCIFCALDPDTAGGDDAKLVPMRDVARPGLRKRQMSGPGPDTAEAEVKVKRASEAAEVKRGLVPVIVTTAKQIVRPRNNVIVTSPSLLETAIKTEPLDADGASVSAVTTTMSSIPVYDFSVVRTLQVSSGDSLIIPPIKQE